MYTLISPEKIQLPPGTVVRLLGSWQDYQQLSQQRGDAATPRLKYRHGEIWLMAPLPQHGRAASFLADVVKVLLAHQGQIHESFTPITMDLPEVSGIEPDYCFYIDHWASVVGQDRIDWATAPPPDLVIEVDVTSFSEVNDYLPYQVPEVWLWQHDRLEIYAFSPTGYTLQASSRYFPAIALPDVIATYLQMAQTQSTSIALQALRRQYPETDLT